MEEYISKWHKEIGIFSKIKPLIILEGNVLDSYQYPVEGSTPKGSILRLPEYLHFYFKDMGYKNIVFFDSLRGFYNTCEEGYLERFAELVEAPASNDSLPAQFKGSGGQTPASDIVRTAMTQVKAPTVVVMDFVSRYIPSPDNLDQCEVNSFTVLLQSALDAKDVRSENGGMLKNLLILITNKCNDIPAWFYLNNPSVKMINLPSPSKEERELLIKGPNFPSFFAADIYSEDIKHFEDHPEELEKIQNKFVALTDGFCFTEINGLRRLCKNERIRIRDLCDVVDLYKYGIRENPWRKLDLKTINEAEAYFKQNIKGQDQAIVKTLDVVKRAITGLSGLHGSSHTRPKGVLFFSGPTGTGKTETAKRLAERVFGDESCYIRFDMSEYMQSHSDQKLFGAPPGYVGYESGGQLTNAVKKKPFSILLFDEIEKADSSILDKFLQILEDGRMTDGQGNTVYFTETIIIFTSNLGIYTKDINGQRHANVTKDMEYPEVAKRVRKAIDNYFKLELGRPEILNRIGENIVVFDFIRPKEAVQILDMRLNAIVSHLAEEKKIKLVITEKARETLIDCAMQKLDEGGRGIGNAVEYYLLNPLSRYLFDNYITENAILTVDDVDTEVIPPEIKGSFELM